MYTLSDTVNQIQTLTKIVYIHNTYTQCIHDTA